MKRRLTFKMKYIIVKTTFESKKDAEEVAKKLINSKLAACIQLSEMESYYRWDNKMTQAKEYKLEIKTSANNYKKIEKLISKNCKYKIPEIIATEIKKGSKKYLNWMRGEIC
ncbi:MAG: divalent-cation tolerance protein CutA [Candidatus Pacearchaeota archaeon]